MHEKGKYTVHSINVVKHAFSKPSSAIPRMLHEGTERMAPLCAFCVSV